jgi:hypothetical protein
MPCHGQDDVAWFRARFWQQGGTLATGGDVDPLGRAGELPRVVIRAQPVGPPLHQAVRDLNACGTRRRQQSRDVGQRLATCLGRQHGETGVGPYHRALHFLRDHGGVRGRHQLREVGLYEALALVGEMSSGGDQHVRALHGSGLLL